MERSLEIRDYRMRGPFATFAASRLRGSNARSPRGVAFMSQLEDSDLGVSKASEAGGLASLLKNSSSRQAPWERDRH